MLDIGRPECEKLISRRFKTNTYKILSYQLTPLDGGRSGIMGEHWILKIQIENNPDVTFFIKSRPQMESQIFYIKHVDISYKEENFYKKIVPAMKNLNINLINEITPTCWMIRTSEFLIFEDLSALNFKIYPSINPLSYNAIKLGLSTLAKLHACSFAFEETMSSIMKQKYRIIDYFEKELQETFYSSEIPSEKLVQSIIKSIPTQIGLFPELYTQNKYLNEEKLEDYILSFWKNIKNYVKPSKQYRNIICHADIWSANIMYQEVNNIAIRCILIDFQMHRYCPPAQDVLVFIYLTTDREFRNKFMRECLDFYYESLTKTLNEFNIEIGNVLTKSDFEKSCWYYELFAIGQCMGYSHLTKVKSTVLEELFANTERSKYFMYVDRSDFLTEFCAKDAFYKEKQKESLLNFMDKYLKLNDNE